MLTDPNEIRQIAEDLLQVSEKLRVEADALLRTAKELDSKQDKPRNLRFP